MWASNESLSHPDINEFNEYKFQVTCLEFEKHDESVRLKLSKDMSRPA